MYITHILKKSHHQSHFSINLSLSPTSSHPPERVFCIQLVEQIK